MKRTYPKKSLRPTSSVVRRPQLQMRFKFMIEIVFFFAFCTKVILRLMVPSLCFLRFLSQKSFLLSTGILIISSYKGGGSKKALFSDVIRLIIKRSHSDNDIVVAVRLGRWLLGRCEFVGRSELFVMALWWIQLFLNYLNYDVNQDKKPTKSL